MDNLAYINKKHKIVAPGDHIVLIYENEDEVIETISQYIKASLLRNEQCLYIAGDADTIALKNKLKELIDYKKFIKKEQLIILEKEASYAKHGTFNPDKMIKLLIQHAENAVKHDFNGLSITGELSWVLQYDDGIDRIMEYEYKLNEQVFNHYPVSAICRYNKEKFTNEMMSHIIQVHPYLIWQGEIHENPYYLPAGAFKTDNIAKYQVETWLDNISKYTNTKSKFNQKIKRQEEKYEALSSNLKDQIILSISGLLGVHHQYTKDHNKNVAEIAKIIATHMQLSQEAIDRTYYAALLHDIGKTLIPKRILDKQEPLTDEEFSIIMQHPITGYEALMKSPEMKKIANCVLSHHERIDGKGYPYGLAGDEIPLISRIIAVADAFDAMINDRPYRKAFSIDYAINELKINAGKQFDAQVVKVFLKSLHENETIKNIIS